MATHDTPMTNQGRDMHTRTTGRTDDSRHQDSPHHLARLSDMDDFDVADGEPDIRGWDIRTSDGRKIGEVDELLVDTQQMKVRYVELSLDDELARDDEHRHAILPIGTARLDDDEDEVIVNLSTDELRTLPPYTRGQLTRDQELELVAVVIKSADGNANDSSMRSSSRSSAPSSGSMGNQSDDFYGQSYFDDRRPFEGRRAKTRRSPHGADAADGDDRNYLSRSR
jgi:photosynthetic reaction center H subunit